MLRLRVELWSKYDKYSVTLTTVLQQLPQICRVARLPTSSYLNYYANLLSPEGSRGASPIEMPISPGHTLMELIKDFSADVGEPVPEGATLSPKSPWKPPGEGQHKVLWHNTVWFTCLNLFLGTPVRNTLCDFVNKPKATRNAGKLKFIFYGLAKIKKAVVVSGKLSWRFKV